MAFIQKADVNKVVVRNSLYEKCFKCQLYNVRCLYCTVIYYTKNILISNNIVQQNATKLEQVQVNYIKVVQYE